MSNKELLTAEERKSFEKGLETWLPNSRATKLHEHVSEELAARIKNNELTLFTGSIAPRTRKSENQSKI